MSKRLDGKIAIITGGSRGLGAAMAHEFTEQGAKVITVSVGELSYTNHSVEGYKLDVTNTEGCKIFYDYVMNKYGRVDILVNNAGITRDAMTHKMTDEMWDKVIDVNLKGIFNITRYFGPQMSREGKGSIINVSSIAGESGNVGQANYSAAKAGVYGLTKTWAKEFTLKGASVRVNSISPGAIMTDILNSVPEEVIDKIKNQITLKRLGQPSEIAKVALFLASEDSSYITGQNITVSGGMVI